MTNRWAAAMIGAALILLPGNYAKAADLYDEPYPSRHGSAYDDPRYADVYRHPPPKAETYDRYDDDDEPRYSRSHNGYGYNGNGNGYLQPLDRRPRFAGRDHGCVPRHAIRDRLKSDGWHDFQDLELSGSIAYVKARRPDGRVFDLKVDRCTGDIVHARSLRGYGPYAYAPRRAY